MPYNDYMYGVERSDEYLAHYGIKGMKWGVQKAKIYGDSKSLAKHYYKATKKLAKLQDRANINLQNEKAKKAGKVAVGGLAGALVGHAINDVPQRVANKSYDEAKKAYDQIHFPEGPMTDAERKAAGLAIKTNPLWNRYNQMADIYGVANVVRPYTTKAGQIIEGAGLGTAAVAGTKAAIHKYRTTKKGHARAVAKAQEFEREMNKAFAGTQYGRKNTSKNRRKR